MSDIQSNFINADTGVDIAKPLVDKSYLIDRYPELADTFKQAGLWLWGPNSQSQLGDNTILPKSSPVQTISGGANWKEVGAGTSTSHSAAIKSDGTLWLWGNNNQGQLGDGSIVSKSSPIQTISGGTNWKQVSQGGSSTAAIKTDGTLWLWGYNFTGELGTNNRTRYTSPVQTISGGTNWKQVSIGSISTAAIKTDGTLWVWGNNDFGQLGDGSIVSKSSPIQTISGGTNWKQVSQGGSSTAAIKTDGTLWVWGQNSDGHLGLGVNTIPISSPVQTVAGGTNWKQVSINSNVLGSILAAIKTDGTLWMCGSNLEGCLGTNDNNKRSSPVQTVSGGTNWKYVNTGYGLSTFAIKTDGTLWVWGYNSNGILGTGDTVNKSSPVQTISAGNNWKTVGRSIAIRDDSLDPL